MNIFYVDYDRPNDNGVSKYTQELLMIYKREKSIQLSCIWTNSYRHTLHEEIIDNVCHIYIPIKAHNSISDHDIECADIILKYAQGKENPIVHFNWINHCSMAWQLKQKKNIATVLTKHCIPWRDLVIGNYREFLALNKAFEKKQTIRINNLRLKNEEIYYDSIDHIITVTECAKRSLNQIFHINSDKITVINNGLSKIFKVNKSEENTDDLKAKYGFDKNEKLILFAGNLNARKGVNDLIDVFEKLADRIEFSNIRLILAGRGDYAGTLKIIKKYWGKITLTGNLDKATLHDFYKMAYMGIVPSYIEQCSYTAIEMMYSGLPIIVSDVDGLKEIVKDDCGLKVKVDFTKKGASVNFQDLTAKISSVLNDYTTAKMRAENAKKYALMHFTSKRMARETIAIYKKLLNNTKTMLDEKKRISSEIATPKGPLVSIILPCYNSEKYLSQCINSVFWQTYKNYELILINDGSTDSTDEIINKIEDRRVIYIKNDKNEGITNCLNKAISIAKGKYIARMDADDIMLAHRLQLQVDFLEKNPDYGMVGGAHNLIDKNGKPIRKITPKEINQELKLAMLFFNPFAHPVITMRADIAKEMLYDPEYNYCEDYELWFRIAQQHKVKNLSTTLLEYRVHEESITSQNHKLMKQNVIHLLSRELDKIGIEHSSRELVLHSAIGFDYGLRYFNNQDKVNELVQWLDKIFNSEVLNQRFSSSELHNFRKKLFGNIFRLN